MEGCCAAQSQQGRSSQAWERPCAVTNWAAALASERAAAPAKPAQHAHQRQHHTASHHTGHAIEQAAGQRPAPPFAECLDGVMQRLDAMYRDAPTDQNIAAVPITERLFIMYGAARRMPLPTARARLDVLVVIHKPRSSSLTMPPTKP